VTALPPPPPLNASQNAPPPPSARRPLFERPWLLVWALAAAGAALRLVPWAAFQGTGFDESLYAFYLNELSRRGLLHYPDIVDAFLALQKTLTGSILPPTRFLYIFFAYLWHLSFGTEPLACFHAISRLFSVLTLAVGGRLIQRLLGNTPAALGAFALLVFSPLQIHMAQHALVDGFFEFWALLTLLTLWECLQNPGHRGWLAGYGVALAMMVATKENAFFVFVAVLAILAANRWLAFGRVTRPLLICTLAGPAAGVAILANVSGGLPTLCQVYLLGVPKNLQLVYAIQTGDGPWYRYLLDLMTVSPLVLVLACAGALRVGRAEKALCFLLVFIGASYLLMANVKYGMNLRYGVIWDVPLRILAIGECLWFAARFGRWRGMAFAGLVAGLCAFDLSQYYRLAVLFPLYELVPDGLLHALHVLKG
jgi:4-amino-4-deoxy-L-arabinose transferase-like glycosyltransferase